MIINYKKLDPDAHDPVRAHPEDFCWDIAALGDHYMAAQYATIPTGLQINIPRGYYGMILSRSGLASKHGLFVLNAPGIIDAGYAGEIQIILGNIEANTSVMIHDGERIAQITILPFEQTHFSRNDQMIIHSTRGTKGLGSSGY